MYLFAHAHTASRMRHTQQEALTKLAEALDSHRSESDEEECSESMETISKSQPLTSPELKDDPGQVSVIKKTAGRYYSEYGYLNTMSRQEQRRIEQEILKGYRPGEY